MKTPHSFRFSAFRPLAGLIIGALLGQSFSALAATGTWSNTSGGLWSATGNWVNGAMADGSGFTADFNSINITTNPTVVHMDASHTLTSLIFGDTNTSTAASWVLDNNGNSANILTLAGSSPTVTVNALSGTNAATISATIAGNAGLIKAGSGQLFLAGTNTYTGLTQITGGVLDVGVMSGTTSTGVSGSSGILMTNGAILQGSGTMTRALSGNSTPGAGQISSQNGGFAARGGQLTVNFGGSGTTVQLNGAGYAFGSGFVFGSATSDNKVVVQNGINLNTGAGNTRGITVNSGVNTLGSTAEIAGSISSAGTTLGVDGGLTKNGTGILLLSASNSYSGATIVNIGTLQMGNSGALGTGGLTYSTGAGGVGAVVNNLGSTTVVSGATLDLNGQTNVNEVIQLFGTGVGGNGALVNNSSTAASIGNGVAVVTISGGYNNTVPTITLSGGGGSGATVVGSLGVTSQSFTINPGTTTYSVAPTVTISTGTGLSNATATAVLNADGTVKGIVITNQGDGYSSTAAPTITFSGGTVVSQGTNPTGTGNTNNYVIDTQLLSSGSGYTSSPTVTFSSGVGNSGSATLSQVILGGNASAGGRGDITINAVVSGSYSLTKVGVGTLTLAGSNTYTGATIINAGTLAATGGNAIADSGSVSLANTAGATFLLNSNETIGSLTGGGTNGGNVNLGSNTLSIGADNTNTTYSGNIFGAGGITKVGLGTLTIYTAGTTSQTYTGATTVNGGMLLLNMSGMTTPTNIISASSGLVLGGGGILKVTGNTTKATSQTFASTTVNAGGGQILGGWTNSGLAETINLGTLNTTASGGSLLLGYGILGGIVPAVVTTTSLKDATGIYGGRVISYNGSVFSGYDWATSSTASGTNTLTNYTGYTTMTASGVDTANSRISSSQSNQTLALTGARTTNTLKIEADSDSAYTPLALGSNLLTLTGGGLLITGGANNLVAPTITGNAGVTTLTAGNGSGSYDLIVQQYDIAGANIAAVIGDNGSHAVTLVKAGNGSLTLSGVNTYSGNTYVNAGSLFLDNTSALPTTGSVTVAASAGFGLRVGGSGYFSSADIDALFANTFSRVNMATGASVGIDTTSGNFTYATGQSGFSGLIKNGGNTLYLTGTNTYTGMTVINGGVLDVGTLNGAGGTSLSANSGVLINNGGILQGNGTFTRSFSDNITPGVSQISSYTGGFAARGGTLTVSLGTSFQIIGSMYQFGGGAGLIFGSPTADSKVVLTSNIDLNGSLQRAVQVNSGVGGDYAEISGTIFNTNASSATSGLIKNGTGRLVLSASNTYLGTTSINAGVLQALEGVGLPTNSFISLAGGVFQTSGSFTRSLAASGSAGVFNMTTAGGGFSAKGGQLTVNLGCAGAEQTWVSSGVGTGILGTLMFGSTSADALTLFQNGINLNNAGGSVTRTINVTAGAGGDAAQISGNIRNSNGSGGITVTGNGNLILSGSNSYSGATTINGGKLTAGSVNALSANSSFSLANTAGVSLDLAGYNNTVGSLSGGGVAGGNVTLGGATLTLSGSGSATYAGGISGNGGIIKTGTGTQTFTGANTFTGTTVINGGKLAAGSTTALSAASDVTLANVAGAVLDLAGYNNTVNSLSGGGSNGGNVTLGGATLTLSGSASTTYAGVIAGDGNLVKNGAGTLTLTGENTYGGTTTVNAGTLQIGADGNSGSLSAASITGSLGAILALNRAGTLSIDSAIGGDLAINQIGSGTTVLNNVNTYTGATSINSGMLQINGDNSAATGVITVNNGGSLVIGGITGADSAVNVNSGGTLYGSGAGVINGAVQVNNGGHFVAGYNGIANGFQVASLTLGATSTSDIRLGTAAGSQEDANYFHNNDRTDVAGALALGGTLNLIDDGNISGLGSAGAGSYRIFTQSGIASGNFSAINNISGYHARVDTSTDGNVYVDNFQIAAANNVSTPVHLGITHVGQAFASSTVSITNTSASNGYAEGLNVTKGAVTGQATVTGTNISNLAGGSTNTNLAVGLNGELTAGMKNGTVTIGFSSNGANSGYGTTNLDSQVISVDGQVNQYAQPTVAKVSGDGILTGGGTSYVFDLGKIDITLGVTTGYLSLSNALLDAIYQDLLSGSFSLSGQSDKFILSGLTDINELAIGGSHALSIGLDTTATGMGSYTAHLLFSPESVNADGSTTMSSIDITLEAQVVPEPSTWAMVASGLGMLVGIQRIRKKGRGAR